MTSNDELWSQTTAAILRTFLAPISELGSRTTQSDNSNAFCGIGSFLLPYKHFNNPGSREVLTISNSIVLGFDS